MNPRISEYTMSAQNHCSQAIKLKMYDLQSQSCISIKAPGCEYKPIRGSAGVVWHRPGDWQMGVHIEIDTHDPAAEAAHAERVRLRIDFYGGLEQFICSS